jgi:glycosyltransferase involved in cell wall biosynthesis
VAAALAPEDANIRVVPFVAEPKLGPHLAAADVHMVSLRPEWSGIVEPSKFFAALAAGRPVIFAGPPDSLIGECIARHGVGWLLDAGSADRVAAELRALAKDGPRLRELQGRCHALYHAAFSRQRSLAEWKRELARLIAPEAPRPTEGEHG